MKKNLVLLDGNKKFYLGGGQVVTLSVLNLMKEAFNTHLIEVERSNEFYCRAQRLTKNTVRIYGITALFQIYKYLKFHKLNSKETILYSASKLSHLYLIFFKILGYTTIVHIHSINSKKSPIYYLLKFVYKFPDQIITTSNYVKNYLNLDSAKIIYNCVNYECIDMPSNVKFKNKIIFVGSVEEFKGIEDFCEVAKYFKNSFSFEVWGKGSLEEVLKEKYPEIKFVGFVSDVQSKLYSDAYLLILPSRVPEAFGLVIAEAFASNVPVITTNIGAQNEIVDLIQGCGTYKVSSIDELKKQIEFFQSYENYHKILSRLKKWDQYFSKNIFSKNILEILEKYNGSA